MIQLDDPPSFMRAMFSDAARMGASTIRLDVAPALVFPDSSLDPDFSGLDEVMALAGEYHLRVVADLLTIPTWLADCPASTPTGGVARCAASDLPAYGAVIGQIVTHADRSLATGARGGISPAARPPTRPTRSLLRLPGGRRPGTYRLTVTARNAHGRGPSRTLWLTVA